MLSAVALSAFLASALTLFTGFGLATILMPVMAIFIPVPQAIAATAIVHGFNNLVKCGVMWRWISWREAWQIGGPAILGAIVGAFVLAQVAAMPVLMTYTVFGLSASVQAAKLIAGTLLFAFAVFEGFRKPQISASRTLITLGALLSGFFGGLSGQQGAFRSAVLLKSSLDKESFIATNAVIAAIVDTTRLLVYTGFTAIFFHTDDKTVVLVGMAAAFLGVIAGRLVLVKVDWAWLARLVLVMIGVMGLLLASGLV